MDISCGRTRRSGRSGTEAPNILSFGKALTVQWFAGTRRKQAGGLEGARYWWTGASGNIRSARRTKSLTSCA